MFLKCASAQGRPGDDKSDDRVPVPLPVLRRLAPHLNGFSRLTRPYCKFQLRPRSRQITDCASFAQPPSLTRPLRPLLLALSVALRQAQPCCVLGGPTPLRRVARCASPLRSDAARRRRPLCR